jgi:hypothetical protein
MAWRGQDRAGGLALAAARVPPQADLDRSFVLDDVGLALTRQRRGVVSGRRM